MYGDNIIQFSLIQINHFKEFGMCILPIEQADSH